MIPVSLCLGGYRPRVGGGLTSGFERACKRGEIKDKDVTQLETFPLKDRINGFINEEN